MSKEELVACFLKDDAPLFHTGKLDGIIFPMTRTEAHQTKTPHIICRIYAFSEGEQYLIQKRAKDRAAHPNLYTDSASGHIRYHPHFDFPHIEQEAWRELDEEMGVQVVAGRLIDIHLEEFRSGGCELAYNFLALVTSECTPDPVETAPESGFRSRKELGAMLVDAPFVNITKEYWNRILKDNIATQFIEEFRNRSQPHQEAIKRDISSSAIGAMVGRFQPFHIGHLKLVQAIFKQVSFLKIGVGSAQYHDTPDNPFTYEERKQMILRALAAVGVSSDCFEVFPIPDLHDMAKWTAEVQQVFGEFDVFYSNNSWIRELFDRVGKNLGIPMKFDFNVLNGTRIRKMIFSQQSLKAVLPSEVIQYLEEIDAFSRFLEIYQNKA